LKTFSFVTYASMGALYAAVTKGLNASGSKVAKDTNFE